MSGKVKLIWACDVCITSGKAIRAEPWQQLTGLDYPFFAYFDRTLKCEDCGKDFLFSAHEQHYWYDVLQFHIDSYPKQCVAGRRKRRFYKRHFHDLQRAIEALDPNSSEQLAQVAEGFLKTDNPHRALEFFRRARNKAKKVIRSSFNNALRVSRLSYRRDHHSPQIREMRPTIPAADLVVGRAKKRNPGEGICAFRRWFSQQAANASRSAPNQRR